MTGDQMLCIVTPLGDVEPMLVASRLRASQEALDTLFHAHGKVHYATFTLLPPSPAGTADPSGATLSLTLAIDAEVDPEELVAQLVELDVWTLRAVNADCFPAAGPAPDSLRRFLLDPDHLHHATGGFVGARDRSVAQIHAEARLAGHLRAVARKLARPFRTDAGVLAASLSGDVLADPSFTWARQPAPHSKWRSDVTPWLLRFGATAGHGIAFLMLALAVAALALIGHINELAVAALNGWIGARPECLFGWRDVLWEGGPLGLWLRGTLLVVLVMNSVIAFLVRIRQLPLVAIELTLAFGALVVVVALGVLPFLIWQDLGSSAIFIEEWHVAVSHVQLGIGVLALLLVAAAVIAICGLVALLITPPYRGRGALVVASLCTGAVGLAVLHVLLVLGAGFADRFGLPGGHALVVPGWGWQAVDKAAIVVLALSVVAVSAVFATTRSLRLLSKWLPLLNTPRPRNEPGPYRRLHQTAPSIDVCEAAWAERTSIMVSVCEMRRPAWLFAPIARFFLWLVTSLGWHVFSEGKLGSIGSIQYAHWHLIDKNRRMLFCANFDGDFGGYLDAFITGGLPLLNLFWRWTCLDDRPGLALGGPEFDAAPTTPRRFPKTRLLLFAGCWSEQQFKAYARDSMLPFQYHFAAYDLRLGAILRATRLRDALSASRDLTSDDTIMRALES